MANRVTTSMVYGSLNGALQDNLKTVMDLQRQFSTQNKYNKISDNPGEIMRGLALESTLSSSEYYTSTQRDASDQLKHSQVALNSALDILQTIRTKVIYAGNGALDRTAAAAIADEIDALKDQLIDVLNSKVAGKYLFGGTDTATKPFVMDKNGNIKYQGTDERIRYEIEQGVWGDVSFSGSEILQNNDRTYFICSHYVPADWKWTGREEKVQITVGGRTLPVFIPEEWLDEIADGSSKPTDFNQFRDPGEVRGISLDDVATLMTRALKEQGSDMLVSVSVDKNPETGLQRLLVKSNTGEPVAITGWPDTDYLPMPQSVAGLTMEREAADPFNVVLPDWNHSMLLGGADAVLAGLNGKTLSVRAGSDSTDYTFTSVPPDMATLLATLNGAGVLPAGVTASAQGGRLVLTSANGAPLRVDGSASKALFGDVASSEKTKYNGLMGSVNTLGWRDDTTGKGIRITLDGRNYDFDFAGKSSISDLVNEINKTIPGNTGDLPTASLISGRLVLQSSLGSISVIDHGTPGGTAQLFGSDAISSSTSSLTLTLGDAQPVKIYVNSGDNLEKLAERISAIEGIYARTSADGDQLVIAARRTGKAPDDPLAVDAAKEKLNYPPFTLKAEGMALSLFDYTCKVDPVTGIETGIIASKEQTRPIDHSHIDLFDYLGMETALKSVEFKAGENLTVGTWEPGLGVWTGSPLHWRVMSGSHVTEIKLSPGQYTMEQIAERLKNSGIGWLDVSVDAFRSKGVPGEDSSEKGLGTSYNEEKATSRLVIRGNDGAPVVLMDMNAQRYAEKMGLSGAVRTDANTGLANITFPSAPCLDDQIAGMMRIQMTCGKAYDVRLTRSDVVDKATRQVDRVAVMKQIAKQVNAQAGEEVLKVIIPVDDAGKALTNSASLVALTGEPFSVFDLPVSDPVWNQYSSGIAAQMGIHSGVTSNLALVQNAAPPHGLRDNVLIGQPGTIRFETLGQKVEIDVSAADTVKDVMDRLRTQAGDWLYVNYFDAHMGSAGGQEGDFPILSIAAKDGSVVNVVDVRGAVANDRLLLSTGIQGTAAPVASWSAGAFPGSVLDISVAGYTHTIDLTAMRDVNGSVDMDAEDLVATINARMQDYDVRAELNKDGRLVLYSPRGYTITAQAWTLDNSGARSADRTADFFGTVDEKITAYRGGYDLGNQSSSANPANRAAPGIYTQNTTVRGGSNQRVQNFFGVLDDISVMVRSENREALSEKVLPKIDSFIDNLLKVMSMSGALQNRYDSNVERMEQEQITITESYSNLMKADPIKVLTELTMARSIYESTLAIIAQIVQPTLLNYLR